jgi:nitrogen fixation/metabolism regulation signal transduction histidine kinase
VPEDDRDRIFDPYFTRKSEGWGVGLAHAGDILREYYDGELNLVDRGPQPGATFQALIRRRTG